VNEWSTAFAQLIAGRHPDWADRHEGEMALHGAIADATGLTIARAWVATV
jgi:hypothetical protein